MNRLFDRIQYWVRVQLTKRNYRRCLANLRKAAQTRPIRVVFLVSEIAKWKGQGIFDLMKDSDRFEPVIGIMELTRFAHLPVDELRRRAEEKVAYFESRGMKAVDIWRYGTRDSLSAREVGADIVFYQQPWDLPKSMRPWNVAKNSLTFYFPYSTPNRWLVDLDLGHKLHHFIFGYIVINAELAELYERMKKDFVGAYVPNLLPFGHPTLDDIAVDDTPPDLSRPVIYAPHWSIQYGGLNPPLKYSTFLETGRTILDYAKAHPEIKWAFKPHPDLMATVVRTGAMTQAEIDAYCHEWEMIGESCYTAESDYRKLFARSRALVTDCGSFLTEYGCTGKPVIRLICHNLNVDPHPAVKGLYAQYYNVRTDAELRDVLEEVVRKGNDPKRTDRRRELDRANLVGHNVARRIVDHIDGLCAKAIK